MKKNLAALPIYSQDAQKTGEMELDTSVFDGVVNKPSIYQAVNAFLANRRKGLAATKTRGEVSGGGKKPWKQKGTGRARVGSTRSPLWRHGGVVFGPHPRDFSYTLPQKIRSLALRSVLNAKVNEDSIVVIDAFKLNSLKTKEAAAIIVRLNTLFRTSGKDKKTKSRGLLLLLDNIDETLRRSLRNIDSLDINRASDTHAYEVLTHRKIIVNKAGLEQLCLRLNSQSRKEE